MSGLRARLADIARRCHDSTSDAAIFLRDPALDRALEDADRVPALEDEIDTLRAALAEIATAKGFDNIGNWARNRARAAIDAARGKV